jgi:hypothetical protein
VVSSFVVIMSVYFATPTVLYLFQWIALDLNVFLQFCRHLRDLSVLKYVWLFTRLPPIRVCDKRVLQGDKPNRVYRSVAGKGKIEELQ